MGVPLITSKPGVEEALLVPPGRLSPSRWSPVGASSLFHPLMLRVLLPFKRSQGFKVLFEHFEGELLMWLYWNLMDFTPEGRPDIPTPPQNFRSEFLEKNYLNKE